MKDGIAPGRLLLDDQLCFALYAATNAITRAYRPLLGAIGLTYPQYLVMMALWQDGSSTIGDIARRLQLGASALTPLVDGLERAGLLGRLRETSDRRVVTVSLTQEGAALEAKALEAQRAVVCRIGMPDNAIDTLRAELADLVARMSTVDSVAAGCEPVTARS